MNSIFLDTVGLLSLWDSRDQWHVAAEAAFAEIMRSKAHLTTTSYVLLECGNAAARRPYKQAVDRLRQKLEKRGRCHLPCPRRLGASLERIPRCPSTASRNRGFDLNDGNAPLGNT